MHDVETLKWLKDTLSDTISRSLEVKGTFNPLSEVYLSVVVTSEQKPIGIKDPYKLVIDFDHQGKLSSWAMNEAPERIIDTPVREDLIATVQLSSLLITDQYFCQLLERGVKRSFQ